MVPSRPGEVAVRGALFASNLNGGQVCTAAERFFVHQDIHDAFVAKLVEETGKLRIGNGLGKLKGRVFRIGHLGDFNDLMLAGTLSGVEMGLTLAGVPHSKGGVAAALDSLAASLKAGEVVEMAGRARA